MSVLVHGFDIDGVVTKYDAIVECVARDFKGFTKEHLVDYSISKSLHLSGFIEEEREFQSGVFFSKYGQDILADACISEGFLDYYSRVKSRGDKIHFITARRDEDEKYTRNLFKANGIDYESVYHTSDPLKKDSVIKDMGINLFYEDNLQTGLRVASTGVIDVIIYDAPYNQIDKFPYESMRRIKSWGELE